MIRNLLAVSLVTFVAAQYPGARNNVNPADNIPAWYQMSKPAQAPPAYPYERREQYERMERPQTNIFAGYPTFSNPRSAYPTEAVAPHPQAPVRRYQGNTDNPWGSVGAVPRTGPHALSVERYHKLLLLKKLSQRKPTTPASTTTTVTPEESEEVVAVTSERTVSPYEKPPLSLEKIYSTIRPGAQTAQEPTKKTAAMKTFKLKYKKITVKPKTTASTAETTVDGWMTPQIETGVPKTATEEPELSTKREIMVTQTVSTEPTEPSTSQETTQQLIQETKPVELQSTTTSRKPEMPFGGGQIGQRFICRHKSSEEHELHTKRTLAPFRRVDRTFKPRGLRPITASSTGVPESYRIGGGVGAGNWELKQKSLFEYLWPNTELIAAIKDVMAKFKASLDETGIDQDVRLMGNQLKNTWQQLRTGVDRGVRAVKQSAEHSVRDFGHNNNYNYIEDMSPMNEQIGRLFEKAAADATKSKEDKKQ